MPRIAVLCLTLWIAALSPLAAGHVLEMETRDLTSSPSAVDHSVLMVDGQSLRVDAALDDGGKPGVSTIWSGDDDAMIVLFHDRKEALVLDRQSGHAIRQRQDQAKIEWEKALQQIPEAQQQSPQEMLEQRFEEMAEEMARDQPQIEILRTTETGTSHGYDWVRYEAWDDGTRVREYLVTDLASIPGGAETSRVIAEMAEFLTDLTDPLQDRMDLQNPFREIGELDGFPVVIRQFRDGLLVEETVVEEARTEAIDDGIFSNPGYPIRDPWQMGVAASATEEDRE